MSLRVDVPELKKGQSEGFANTLTLLGLNQPIVDVPTTSGIEDIYSEELRVFAEEGNVYLTEAGFIQSIVDFFKGLWNKIVAGLRAAASKGIRFLLDFLGIELTGIEPTGMTLNLGA